MTVTFTTETVVRGDGRTLKVTRTCEAGGGNVTVFVNPADFEAYTAGRSQVQNLFPYLTADECELLLTGVCGPCFDKMCPADEDDA